MTITIYSKPNCPFCVKSKALVKGLGLTYEEKMFGTDFNSLIGGYNQLVEYFMEKGKVNFKGEKI